ncbi:zingipain-2 isoform X2 [Aegilops tauschii subsp. strangulata]|uniref:zingipain-2 isoform X2 n=1 Tax=Aegilops tauschii subsp. strangulata TaxID=200361 RepID=UPI000989D7A2|nr:zingipain-2 isoform X2 [Aegilops tauschii subsp. strangulata]
MANVLLSGLRGAKQLGQNFRSACRSLSSGQLVEPGYVFGRKCFGPDYGVTTSVGQYGLPKSVDWRKVPWLKIPVKDQRGCGNCYIQASLVGIGSLHSIITGINVELSSQHVLDANTITNSGCMGGTIPKVFDFVMRGGVVLESAYPYTGKRGFCQDIKAKGLTIEGWAQVAPAEEALMYAVAHQPVAVGVAAGIEFENYQYGVMNVPVDHGILNHAMLLIGYNATSWLLLNSWSEAWGIKGACRILRKSPNSDGSIGILSRAYLPLNPSFTTVRTRTESCPCYWSRTVRCPSVFA